MDTRRRRPRAPISGARRRRPRSPASAAAPPARARPDPARDRRRAADRGRRRRRVAAIYREFYSPTAFVERYLGLLAEGRAADALAVPGVSRSTPPQLEAAGLPATASDALLRPRRAGHPHRHRDRVRGRPTDGVDPRHRRVPRGRLSRARRPSRSQRDGCDRASPRRGASRRARWRSWTCAVERLDDVRRQRVRDRQAAGLARGRRRRPARTRRRCSCSRPGIYSVSVDTPISATPRRRRALRQPVRRRPGRDAGASRPPEFVAIVQERVEEFLDRVRDAGGAAAHRVPVRLRRRRIASSRRPRGRSPRSRRSRSFPTARAGASRPRRPSRASRSTSARSSTARSATSAEDVPFLVTGTIAVLPDGSASITVGGPDYATDAGVPRCTTSRRTPTRPRSAMMWSGGCEMTPKGIGRWLPGVGVARTYQRAGCGRTSAPASS